jgi:hypothetical protein
MGLSRGVGEYVSRSATAARAAAIAGAAPFSLIGHVMALLVCDRESKGRSTGTGNRLLPHQFGDGAGVWVRMQATSDTWNAEREEDVSKIPTLRVKAA